VKLHTSRIFPATTWNGVTLGGEVWTTRRELQN